MDDDDDDGATTAPRREGGHTRESSRSHASMHLPRASWRWLTSYARTMASTTGGGPRPTPRSSPAQPSFGAPWRPRDRHTATPRERSLVRWTSMHPSSRPLEGGARVNICVCIDIEGCACLVLIWLDPPDHPHLARREPPFFFRAVPGRARAGGRARRWPRRHGGGD